MTKKESFVAYSIRAGRLPFLVTFLFLAVVNAGCTQLMVRAKYEDYQSEIDFGRTFHKNDVAQTRIGLEVATEVCPYAEIYVDGADARFKWEEDPPSPDADGYAVGLGVRAAQPKSAGIGLDWGGRGGYFSTDENMRILGVSTDMDFKGWEMEGNVGAYYAFEINDDMFLTPRGGYYSKAQNGRTHMRVDQGRKSHADFEYWSSGGYVGLSMVFPDWEISGVGYAGNDDMTGFLVYGGLRF